MDKLEYIPGDLVMTNGVPLGTAKDVVYRVTSSDSSKTLKLDDGTVLKGVVCLENIEGAEFGDKGYLFGDCCSWVKDIIPIPLVPAILEKNVWEKEKYGLSYYKKESQTLEFRLIGKTYGWTLRCGNKDLIEKVEFIHQLQHILFGLNINNEMDV
jgi:hypothetical protein